MEKEMVLKAKSKQELKESIVLEMKDITKIFPGVKALDNVNFKVKNGEIHCLCGENGAGKSTLMKVLSGVYPYGTYEGNIIMEGQEKKFKNIADSEESGIAIIYQELALVPEMMVYENVFLGQEIKKGIKININEMITKSKELLSKVGLYVNPTEKIKNLGIGKQQLIEIAKALNKNVKLLIFDEPTAALNEDDSLNLLELMRKLKSQGVTCIMISHKLKEVISIADSVTVLRDGQTVCGFVGEEIKEENIINSMVGRKIDNIYPNRNEQELGEIYMEIKNFTAYDSNLGRNVFENINLNVRSGEVVGISGLMGAGRTELALAIFGNSKNYKLSGEIYIKGRKVNLNSPREAIENGIAYVTEDRKGNGLILIQNIKNNITLSNLDKLKKNMVINTLEEVGVTNRYVDSLKIKTPSIEQDVGNLSGGNQQKVSLAKWMYTNPKLLILDEPTRGIDVGAKYEIYTLMNRLVESGMGIIMISSELLEIVGMSDRVYVLAEGKIKGNVEKEDISEEKIMALATS